MKINVLELTNNLSMGGTEKTMQIMCKYIDKSQFNVYAAAKEDGPRRLLIERSGVKTYVTEDITGLCRTLKIDIAHIHRAGWSEDYFLKSVKNAGVPTIIETNVFGRLDTSISEKLIDCHLFVSYYCAQRYQMWVKRPLTGQHFQVLYNPIDFELFDNFDFTRDYRKPVIGRISRPDNSKWSDIGIDMYPIVVRNCPDVRYHIMGNTPEVCERFKQLGIPEKNLKFFDCTTDENKIFKFLKDLTVFVHANKTGETFGVVIAEAMAAKLPVVTHNTFERRDNAQTELVEHRITGIVADNANAYGQAVSILLQNPDTKNVLGQVAYQKARDCFDAKKIARALEEIFVYFVKEKGRFPQNT